MNFKRILIALFALCTFFALSASAQSVTVYHTGDTFGRIADEFSQYEQIIDIRKIAALKEHTENSFLADTGNAFRGSVAAEATGGRLVSDLMELSSYDYITLGNSEFAVGTNNLLEMSNGKNYKMFASNILTKGKYEFNNFDIVSFGKARIGFFGLTASNVDAYSHLDFQDVYAIAQKRVNVLEYAGVDVIVCITNLGNSAESTYTSMGLAENVSGIDVIIDGSQGVSYENGIEHNGVLIASAGKYRANVGKVEIEFDEKGIISATASILDNDDIDAILDGRTYSLADEITDAVEKYRQEIEVTLSKEVSKADYSAPYKSEEITYSQTDIGYLVASALKYVTGTTISVIRADEIKGGIDQKDITYNEIVEILPIQHNVTVGFLTPNQLYDILEKSVWSISADESYNIDPSSGNESFLQISGFSFTYDPRREPGDRITSVTTDSGMPLYRVDKAIKVKIASTEGVFGENSIFAKEANRTLFGSTVSDAVVKYLTDSKVEKDKLGEINTLRIIAEEYIPPEGGGNPLLPLTLMTLFFSLWALRIYFGAPKKRKIPAKK